MSPSLTNSVKVSDISRIVLYYKQNHPLMRKLVLDLALTNLGENMVYHLFRNYSIMLVLSCELARTHLVTKLCVPAIIMQSLLFASCRASKTVGNAIDSAYVVGRWDMNGKSSQSINYFA